MRNLCTHLQFIHALPLFKGLVRPERDLDVSGIMARTVAMSTKQVQVLKNGAYLERLLGGSNHQHNNGGAYIRGLTYLIFFGVKSSVKS